MEKTGDLELLLNLLSKHKCIHSLTPFKTSTKLIASDLLKFVSGKIKRVYSSFDGAGHESYPFNKSELLEFILKYLRSYKLVRITNNNIYITKHGMECIHAEDFVFSVTYPYIQKRYQKSKNKKEILNSISSLVKLTSKERSVLYKLKMKNMDDEDNLSKNEIEVFKKLNGNKVENVTWYSTHFYIIPNSTLEKILYHLKNNNVLTDQNSFVNKKNFIPNEDNIDEFEQGKLVTYINKKMSKDQIKNELLNINNFKSEKIIVQNKSYKRDNKTIALIKVFRDFKCQLCGHFIIKKDGSKYIEAAHIKAKRNRGSETPDNIILLCPNHHKEFDLGIRKILKHTKDKFNFSMNNKIFKVNLSLD
jgi:5-methylcytosine-specific restriction endonuclease McrA